MNQKNLAIAADPSASFETKRRHTRCDEFLDTMIQIAPWSKLCAVVKSHYPKCGNGSPPIGLKHMLSTLLHWVNLAHVACEDTLCDSTSLRRFVSIDLGCEGLPNATTILKFRHLLEKYKLGELWFAVVDRVLQTSGMTLNSGTIVDGTMINAPSSTKNEQKAPPEMHQTCKGQPLHFGMTLHSGIDSHSVMTHSEVATAANIRDKHALP